MPNTNNTQNEKNLKKHNSEPHTESNQSNNDQSFTNLQNELEQTKSKLTELTTISQHALADLQNYKKRAEEEKKQFILFANATLINQLLSVLDNFDRALKNIPIIKKLPLSGTDQNQEWINGISSINKELSIILQNNGLSEIVTTNQKFNPQIHEAIMTKIGQQDKILEEVEKGFMLGDKILRRSKVIVGNGEETT